MSTNPLLKVDALYGATKSTKTSRLGDAADYYARKTGKRSRGVFSDPGGYGSIKSLVDQGIVEPFILTVDRGETLIEDMNKLSMGWWPVDHNDPKSKLAPPALDGVAAIFFDSGTSWCELMMSYHENAIKIVKNSAGGESMIATNVKVPEMPKDSYVKSGDMAYRFTGRSDYGSVQGRITSFVRQSAMLSIPSIWTFLESKGTDDTSKQPVYGPDFIGNALTGKCGKWFGNLLHLDLLATEQTTKVGTRDVKTISAAPFMFTRPHIDPDDPLKLPYMAGTRVDRRLWAKMPAVVEPRLDKLYEMIDELSAEAAQMPSPILKETTAK